MGEKWFEFVKRIKKEGNHESLKDAMREASKRKHEWKKDGPSESTKKHKASSKSKTRKTKKTKKARKSRKSRKSRKGKKGGAIV